MGLKDFFRGLFGWSETEEELQKFCKYGLKKASIATHLLFDKALLAVPEIARAKIDFEYKGCQMSWKSKVLVEGTEEDLKPVIQENLERLQRRGDFGHFQVETHMDDCCAQVTVFYQFSFLAVRVWKNGDDHYFACGDAAFDGPAASPSASKPKSTPGASIKFKCSCGKPLSVKGDLSGKKVKCPACKKLLIVPM